MSVAIARGRDGAGAGARSYPAAREGRGWPRRSLPGLPRPGAVPAAGGSRPQAPARGFSAAAASASRRCCLPGYLSGFLRRPVITAGDIGLAGGGDRGGHPGRGRGQARHVPQHQRTGATADPTVRIGSAPPARPAWQIGAAMAVMAEPHSLSPRLGVAPVNARLAFAATTLQAGARLLPILLPRL